MSAGILCHYLDWDSDFFNVRIARLNSNRLTEEIVRNADAWCADKSIDCLYFLADTDDDKTVRLAEKNDFHLVDLRMTFEKPLSGNYTATAAPESIRIRTSEARDIEELRNIARNNHHDTRFYFDRHFSRERCDGLYATWIEQSCRDFADAVFVVDNGGVTGGYITCHLRENIIGQIGLVGVGPALQGKGIGPLLVNQALQWFAKQGVTKVTVVTQGRNIPAQRLYQKCGFLSYSVQFWYHKWYYK